MSCDSEDDKLTIDETAGTGTNADDDAGNGIDEDFLSSLAIKTNASFLSDLRGKKGKKSFGKKTSKDVKQVLSPASEASLSANGNVVNDQLLKIEKQLPSSSSKRVNSMMKTTVKKTESQPSHDPTELAEADKNMSMKSTDSKQKSSLKNKNLDSQKFGKQKVSSSNSVNAPSSKHSHSSSSKSSSKTVLIGKTKDVNHSVKSSSAKNTKITTVPHTNKSSKLSLSKVKKTYGSSQNPISFHKVENTYSSSKNLISCTKDKSEKLTIKGKNSYLSHSSKSCKTVNTVKAVLNIVPCNSSVSNAKSSADDAKQSSDPTIVNEDIEYSFNTPKENCTLSLSQKISPLQKVSNVKELNSNKFKTTIVSPQCPSLKRSRKLTKNSEILTLKSSTSAENSSSKKKNEITDKYPSHPAKCGEHLDVTISKQVGKTNISAVKILDSRFKQQSVKSMPSKSKKLVSNLARTLSKDCEDAHLERDKVFTRKKLKSGNNTAPVIESDPSSDILITSVIGSANFCHLSSNVSKLPTKLNNKSIENSSSISKCTIMKPSIEFPANASNSDESLACSRCRNIWNHYILHSLFRSICAVTVKSRVTFGAIYLMYHWATAEDLPNKHDAIYSLLDRANLSKNLQGKNISILVKWIEQKLKRKEQNCCDIFSLVYLINSSISDQLKQVDEIDVICDTPNPKSDPLSVSSKIVGAKLKNSCISDKHKQVKDLDVICDTPITKTHSGSLMNFRSRLKGSVKSISALLPSDAKENREVNYRPLNQENRVTEKNKFNCTVTIQTNPVNTSQLSNRNSSNTHDASADKYNAKEVMPFQSDEFITNQLKQILVRPGKTLKYRYVHMDCTAVNDDIVRWYLACNGVNKNKIEKEYSTMTDDVRILYKCMPYREVDEVSANMKVTTYRDILSLHNLCIHQGPAPQFELLYKAVVQLLYSRNKVLLLPDCMALHRLTEKMAKQYARCKNNSLLSNRWCRPLIATDISNDSVAYDKITVGEVLSVFCLWKNYDLKKCSVTLEKNVSDEKKKKTTRPPLSKYLLEFNIDTSQTKYLLRDFLKIYDKYCYYAYVKNYAQKAENFLKRPWLLQVQSLYLQTLSKSRLEKDSFYKVSPIQSDGEGCPKTAVVDEELSQQLNCLKPMPCPSNNGEENITAEEQHTVKNSDQINQLKMIGPLNNSKLIMENYDKSVELLQMTTFNNQRLRSLSNWIATKQSIMLNDTEKPAQKRTLSNDQENSIPCKIARISTSAGENSSRLSPSLTNENTASNGSGTLVLNSETTNSTEGFMPGENITKCDTQPIVDKAIPCKVTSKLCDSESEKLSIAPTPEIPHYVKALIKKMMMSLNADQSNIPTILKQCSVLLNLKGLELPSYDNLCIYTNSLHPATEQETNV